MKHVIKLPSYGIELSLVYPDNPDDPPTGTITSELHEKGEGKVLKAALDAVESFILACACAGVNVQSSAFLEAVETVVDKIGNEYS